MHEDWPGASQRQPSRTSPTWFVRAPLAGWLKQAAEAAPARVLDVGCGVKPYYPFFAHTVKCYVGVDVGDNPAADLRGSVEDLPVEDESFDLVLCTQVLEHCVDPARAVRELRRVTAPGGRVLASTHGVQVYHPAPDDLWRWTHTGLERLFLESADWSSVTVSPGAGTAACVAMLVAIYVQIGASRLHADVLARPVIAALTRAAEAVDRRSSMLTNPHPGTIFANYHVTAER